MPSRKHLIEWIKAKKEKTERARRERKAALDDYWSREKVSRFKVYTDVELAEWRERKTALTTRWRKENGDVILAVPNRPSYRLG